MEVLAFVAAIIYVLGLFYLLMGTVGFGLRIGDHLYVEEGFGFLRATYLLLLVLWVCAGLYGVWRITHRPV